MLHPRSGRLPLFCSDSLLFFMVLQSQLILTVGVISSSYKALSQMSTSVVEVWQPEDADPLVPLQVRTLVS